MGEQDCLSVDDNEIDEACSINAQGETDENMAIEHIELIQW